MPDLAYGATTLGIAVAITVALRALPFLLKSVMADSALLTDVGRWMPLGGVAILAIYGLATIELTQSPHGVPELAGVAATLGVHRWRRNPVLSIIAGTTVCQSSRP